MKRLGSILVLLALAGTALATANASTSARLTVCHRTASKAKPYVRLVTTKKVAAADIVPVPRGRMPEDGVDDDIRRHRVPDLPHR